MPFPFSNPKTTCKIFLFSYPLLRLWPKRHPLISYTLTIMIMHNRRLDKVRTCLLLALLRIRSLSLILNIVTLHCTTSPELIFAYCGYLLSFVTKTNHFPVHSGPIQLSRPIYIPIAIK